MAHHPADSGSPRQASTHTYLIEASIGPVQGFIAAARRSRDLWFGSWLLSELSKAAALRIVETCGEASLIFPAPPARTSLAPGSKLNVANKITAHVDRDPRELAGALASAIKKRLAELRDDAFGRVGAEIDRDVATKQVDDLIEFFWVAVPLPLGGDYAAARQQLEALMAARKATRDFVQVKGSHMPKSSLDGLRESVIAEDRYPGRAGNREEREAKTMALYRLFGAGPAERLSGVDLLKRHGNPGAESRFPSTSHMAALPLLRRLVRLPENDRAAATKAWQQYVKTLDSFNLERTGIPEWMEKNPVTGGNDGELLFEDRLSEYLEGEALRAARNALGDFLRAAGAAPLPYYALLHADGDSMGAAIEAQLTPDHHRALSRALAGFAEQVPAVVREHEGALVYAGGDDVLAFLPLHTALACARRLADTFAKRLEGFPTRDRRRPTLSVGLAVSHHLEPLEDALVLAREAEQHAKRVPGKNALAITVAKRSGAERTVVGSWEGTGTLAMDKRLANFVRLYRRDALPAGAAYELGALAHRLTVSPSRSKHAVLQRAMREEAMRILRRKRAEHGKRALDDTTLELLAKTIAGMGEAADPVHRIADELVVAHTFAEAARIAGEEREEEENANVDC